MISVIISLNRSSLKAVWESTVRNSGCGKTARLSVIAVALAAGLALSPFAAHAWSNDPTVNNAVCTSSLVQQDPHLISDGAGGAIITWTDRRSGGDDIYAQRIDSTGAPLWTVNGVPICTEGNTQSEPRLASDGAGGAIITWTDHRSGYNIYAQRINSSGVVQWTSDGVIVTAAGNDQGTPQIISDGTSGAIIAWIDYRSGTNYDIYAQRMDTSGTAQWTTDGVAICTAAGDQGGPQLISDGSNGAIMVWTDSRAGNDDIYARRINSSGTPQWTVDGEGVTTATGSQTTPQLVSDGAGGAIITWMDKRNGTNNEDIYAQRLNSSGAAQWTANGIGVSNASANQHEPQLISDGAGGAIITWTDRRNSGVSFFDIYAQRIDSSGAPLWTVDGDAVTTAGGDQAVSQLVSDGSGGAIIIWSEGYQGGSDDVFAQRINSSGLPQWTANGVAISTAVNAQNTPQLVSSGGGTIIVWSDLRDDTGDIYASEVNSGGGLVPVTVSAFNLE